MAIAGNAATQTIAMSWMMTKGTIPPERDVGPVDVAGEALARYSAGGRMPSPE